MDQSMSRKKSQYKNQVKSSGMVGDVLSRLSSPCLSASDALSSHSISFLANEEADFMIQNDSGCGIRCCWTRTPRFRESNPYSDAEGRPLLFKDVAETTSYEHRSWKLIANETPRSFSHKFRPKSFDELVALDFIAARSNGSLRDAEMMLDQLSLLGKRITMSLAYELIGVVSDDELLDLLDLALSSDTSNTVIRARDLMRSRIDPMQLVTQLANLIMDILAGKCQEDTSEVRRKFSRRHASEMDMQRLSHALKILSETEKQLRMSKNQSTWLTVALLQLSSLESPSLDANDPKSSLGMHVTEAEGEHSCFLLENTHVAREQEDARALLLKGFGVIGALIAGSSDFERTAREAIDAARQLRKLLSDGRELTSQEMIGAVADLDTGHVHFFLSRYGNSTSVLSLLLLFTKIIPRSMFGKEVV
ncbi:hypothetical protein GH714_040594 [Hevea brasiliensis]|uniref:DNA polymerase III gamma subunit domain-containing protein n=1 Tax=Hevea brasiliensis TaxID=3981 RepID=A0A6A6KZ32_HEVBR|nr:hypothetical protein GH714_040594 [Hevea brasiliensis]